LCVAEKLFPVCHHFAIRLQQAAGAQAIETHSFQELPGFLMQGHRTALATAYIAHPANERLLAERAIFGFMLFHI